MGETYSVDGVDVLLSIIGIGCDADRRQVGGDPAKRLVVTSGSIPTLYHGSVKIKKKKCEPAGEPGMDAYSSGAPRATLP